MNKQQVGQVVLSEELLLKHGLKVTPLQIEFAREGQVVCGCLILKKEEYETSEFQERDDFVAVLALKLRTVPDNMFFNAKNLRTVVMLDTEEIADKQQENGGAFAQTEIGNCYFPMLKRVGRSAFNKCPITSLDEENFPVLQEVGDTGFVGCPIEKLNQPFLKQIGQGSFSDCRISSVNLPSLISIGNSGFSNCRSLKKFAAEKIQQVGSKCFSNCPLLSNINCKLEAESFTCPGCDGCPVCYHDVAFCLQRGISGLETYAKINEQALDKVLKKYNIGITVQQALNAEEGSIINECLVLKEEHYQIRAFYENNDFKYVLALRLRHVAKSMFRNGWNMTTAIMPEAVGVLHGSFEYTNLKNCFFPKLLRIDGIAFSNCKIQGLNFQNFPALQSVGQNGFSGCPITHANLPALIQLGENVFECCKEFKWFSASNVEQIGKNCFSYCPLLSSVNCDQEPEMFVCFDQYRNKKCGSCPVCKGEIAECLRRGTAPRKLRKLQKVENSHLTSVFALLEYQLGECEQISRIWSTFQVLQRELQSVLEFESE